ncbi:MAG: GH92 family glycosyl hydrolase [Deltaproteobacteria bacterium]|nr:GH92 family glycosyl hydrolase [Deltaproteobacteria bacterium]
MLTLLALLACKPPEAPDPSQEPIAAYDPLALVDPLIGTGGIGAGIGAINPGPRAPHGMVHVGPDTRASTGGAASFYHCGGYYHPDDQIDGFSHNHAHGMGVPDYTGVLLMPRDGWDPAWTRDSTRSAPFTHEEEVASPGYYQVRLQDDHTLVELTATPRAAVHRYHFAAGAEPIVLLDLAHLVDGEVPEAWVDVDLSAASLDGYQLLYANYSERYGGLKTWVHATFEPAPVAAGTWDDPTDPVAGRVHAEGAGVGAWVEFPAGTEEVTVRLALSYVDGDGARANHAAEVEGVAFDTARGRAEDLWRDELSTVRVAGGTATERVIFHTAHFHAAHWPSLFMDVDGRYRGLDGELHALQGGRYYTDFSLWDTFRTSHPWFILAHQDRAVDFAGSLVQMYRDGGAIPRWPHGHGYTGGMVGTPATQVLAETWLKGLTTGWDAQAGFEGCLAAATGPTPEASRGGIEGYRERGYVAFEDSDGPASLTLEYAWNDAALAGWAADIGSDAAAEIAAQSGHWANTWDPAQGIFVGRYADGSFDFLEHPEWWSDSFVEGNAWQYRWGVPQDPLGMVEVQHGGDVDAFFSVYDQFWADSYAEEDDYNADTYYWHGNEPDLHYAHLGSLLGHPERSDAPVDFVLHSRYRAAPDGLDGNEDGGTLSAWYLLASVGLYPVAGTTTYALSAPLFDRVEIDRPEGTLVIRAPGEGRALAGASLGDQALVSTVEHGPLIAAGELVLTRGE